jgi:hypothetical protein
MSTFYKIAIAGTVLIIVYLVLSYWRVRVGGDYYKTFLGEVYFKSYSQYSFKGYFGSSHKIDGADGYTLKVLNNHNIAKDKNFVYYYGNKRDVDAASYELISDPSTDDTRYAKDKDHVYLEWFDIIEEADPDTFEVLGNSWSRDNISVFKDEGRVAHIDATSFRLFDNDWVGDKNTVYYNLSPLENVDIESFKTLSEEYAVDRNYLYYNDQAKHRLGNINSVRLFEDQEAPGSEIVFVITDSGMYHEGKIVEGADPNSFKILFQVSEHSNYYTDKNNRVYYNGILLEGVSASNLQQIENSNYFTDGEHVIIHDAILAKADPESFSILNIIGLAKDKNSVFSGGKIMPEANPDLYQAFRYENQSTHYWSDGKSVYCNTGLVKEADINSFKATGMYSAEDKNNKYYGPQIDKYDYWSPK